MQGILLAAGYGRRFDPTGRTSKLLAQLPDGRSIAWHAARTLCDALPGSLAVIRRDQSELAAQLIDGGCRILESSDAENGMGSALAHAVRATATADGWLVALADMPWVPGAAIRSVAGAIDGPTRIAAAAFRGQRGHPVAFGAAHGGALAALCGDSGARDLLRTANVRLIDAATAAVLRDVDLATDLFRAR
jgi:molybdenum cofactor cytidylyltransferase